jgi:flagellar hook-length control protein FliK
MSPTLAIQPATPQAPPQTSPSGTTGKKDPSEFSPHLEKAVSGRKPRQHTASDKSGKDKAPQAGKAQGGSKAVTEKTGRSARANTIDEPTTDISEDTGIAEDQADEVKKQPEQSFLAALFATTTQPITAQSITSRAARPQNRNGMPLNCGKAGSPETGKTISISPETGKPENGVGQPASSAVIMPELSPVPAEGLADPAKPGAASKQDTLLGQLQHLIDKANESGTVTITRADNHSKPAGIPGSNHGLPAAALAENSTADIVTAPPETAGTQANGLLVPDAGGIALADGKPAQHLTGVRQDNQEQFIHAKLHVHTSTEEGQDFQEKRQGDQLSQKSMGMSLANGPTNGPSSGADQAGTFSQVSPVPPQTGPHPATAPAQPVMVLPSGTIVHEDEVMQQLADRFQLSGKHIDSRINLRLHPAELGHLKIDLTVKEGSIRANIVAQSHHTLQILEKNIPKLRTVLEHHGFVIDQISVTADPDSVGDFDLFDRQLFSHHDYTPAAPKENRMREATFTLDTQDAGAASSLGGVNVKI